MTTKVLLNAFRQQFGESLDMTSHLIWPSRCLSMVQLPRLHSSKFSPGPAPETRLKLLGLLRSEPEAKAEVLSSLQVSELCSGSEAGRTVSKSDQARPGM